MEETAVQDASVSLRKEPEVARVSQDIRVLRVHQAPRGDRASLDTRERKATEAKLG